MARPPASVRVRATLAAAVVVALGLSVAAVALVLLLRTALLGGLEQSAEQRAETLAAQVEAGTLPAGEPGEPGEDGDADDDAEDEVWQVIGDDGQVLAASQTSLGRLPTEDTSSLSLDGDAYLLVTEDAADATVVVALSRDGVDDSTAALLPLLAGGLPVLLLLVAGVTWVTIGRALAPVERIRAEVEQITGDRLDRRVPEPRSRDEIHRLALTMNAMLARLQRSRERQQRFVADASHELRSPIAGLRQTAEVERAHPGALPEGELVDAVLEESERMQRLVEQMLLLTRADEGVAVAERRDVDVDDLVLTEARRVRRTGLDVQTREVGPGRVVGDPGALSQVVRNLVDNAARHATSTVALAVRVDAGGVALVVDDDGPGVPEADRQRVLERFVRLDDARSRDAGGSGLGLAIVAESVAAHGGTVQVMSAPIGGARFVVTLPA